MQSDQLKRREFITLLGGAMAAWPFALHAQQPAMPVIGFLNGRSRREYARQLAPFHRRIGELGFVEGQNLAIEHRWAEGPPVSAGGRSRAPDCHRDRGRRLGTTALRVLSSAELSYGLY